jgi:hypothetical protein
LYHIATEYIVGQTRFASQDIGYRWSGQVMEPTNSMAFIGHNPNGDGSNNI